MVAFFNATKTGLKPQITTCLTSFVGKKLACKDRMDLLVKGVVHQYKTYGGSLNDKNR